MRVATGVMRPLRYAGWLLAPAIVATSAGVIVGVAALTAAARAYVAWLGAEGAPATIGGWSFTAAYALLGAVTGGVIGCTLGVARGLGHVEADLRPALQAESERAAAERGLGRGPRITTAELRGRYERFADEAVARTVGALRVPGAALVARLVRARLRQRLLDDFLAACEREGVSSVGPAEITRWLAAQGPAYLLAPVYFQLGLWRWVAAAVGVLAAVAPLLLVRG